MATHFFHTRDPIANLRVVVTARKVALGVSRDDDAPVGAVWNYAFTWQEKLWPFSTRKATTSKPKKNATPSERDAAAEVSLPPSSVHHGVALCSYVDADNYDLPYPNPPTTSLAPPPHVIVASTNFHLSQISACSRRSGSHKLPQSANRDRAALRAHREEIFRQMHLVLRIGNYSNSGQGNHEDLVLASLRYYPHTGLLCMTPGFSVCIADPKDVDAMEKGPKLSTYRIVSRVSGAQFEYALDNENELCPVVSSEDQRLVRELQRQEELDDRARVDEWRNKHGDVRPLDISTTMPKRVKADEASDQTMVLLEIVSVTGVDSPDPIHVNVDLLLPTKDDDTSTWRIYSGCCHLRTRPSHVSVRGEGRAFASFGFHTQFVLTRVEAKAVAIVETKATAMGTSTTMPPLKLTVVAHDSWGRERSLGQTEMQLPLAAGYLDTEACLWRHVAEPREDLEAFFLGCDIDDTSGALTTATAVGASTSMLSRLGRQTVSTNGRVRVRLQVAHSRPRSVKPPAPAAPLSLPGPRGISHGGVLKRSVEEILQSVKASQHHSSMVRSSALSSLPLPTRSVTAILARLNNQGTSPSAG